MPSGWTYFACVDESYNERLLQGFSYHSSSVTPLACVTECGKMGYTIAGTEYGDEVSTPNIARGKILAEYESSAIAATRIKAREAPQHPILAVTCLARVIHPRHVGALGF